MPKPTRLCDIEGCGRKHSARGVCAMHYKQAGLCASTRYPRACRVCGTDYLSARKDGQFCSDTYRAAMSRLCLLVHPHLDRERRGKAPRMTNWSPEDKRYWHLTQTPTELAA